MYYETKLSFALNSSGADKFTYSIAQTENGTQNIVIHILL